eukprot:TRINITY_DN3563_c1_g1_i2.p1 TRINITY_DN3563_c1_g1~~TRINITY_DN3563_c1_g1_i2.p1  ORF type:complete len:872 (+),score=344.97 TRINITY_DN3563_c1_g1_i2:70-2616(+)
MGCGESKELSDAVKEGDLPAVRKIMEHPDFKINDKRRGFRSDNPLFLACQAGQTAVVKYLLAKHHDMNGAQVGENEWLTPLYEALRHRHTPVVKVMMQKGKALINAVKDQDTEELQDLLEQGYDKNMLDELGNSVLYYAVDVENEEIVQQLCHVEVDINYFNRDGMTALHLACARGNMDLVQMLLEYGAKIDFKTAKACTPICHAAAGGHAKLVEEMICHGGANRNVTTAKGQCLLMLAATNGRYETCEYLLNQENFDPEVEDKSGNSAIANARYNGHARVVRLLQEVRDERKGVGSVAMERSEIRRTVGRRRQSLNPEAFKYRPASPGAHNSPRNLQKQRRSIRQSVHDLSIGNLEQSQSTYGESSQHQRSHSVDRGLDGSMASFRGSPSHLRQQQSMRGSMMARKDTLRRDSRRGGNRSGSVASGSMVGSPRSRMRNNSSPRVGMGARRRSTMGSQSVNSLARSAGSDLGSGHGSGHAASVNDVDCEYDDTEGDSDAESQAASRRSSLHASKLGSAGGMSRGTSFRPGDLDDPEYSADVDYVTRDVLNLPESENVLGVGSSGAPVVAGWGRAGKEVAIKRYPEAAFAGRDFEQEFAELWRIRHPRIISLLYVCTEVPGEVWLSMERMQYNLEEYLEHIAGGEPLEEGIQIDIALDIGEALKYFHGKKLVYGPMKPGNVLLDDKGRAKLIPRAYSPGGAGAADSPESSPRSLRARSKQQANAASQSMNRMAMARSMGNMRKRTLTQKDYEVDMQAYASMMCLLASGGQDDGAETEQAPDTACEALADAITLCFYSSATIEKVLSGLKAQKMAHAKKMREAIVDDGDDDDDSGSDSDADDSELQEPRR